MLHSSCKYIKPLAMLNAICTLWFQSGLVIPNRKLAKEPHIPEVDDLPHHKTLVNELNSCGGFDQLQSPLF